MHHSSDCSDHAPATIASQATASQATASQATASQESVPQTKQTQLAIALVLIGSFSAIEFVVGHLSHSLALIAESGHLLTDGLALALALLATWASQRTAKTARSRQWELWAALVNSLALVTIALWIIWEGIHRLQLPPSEIASLPMLITAGIGLLVNGGLVAILHRGSHHDLNLRAAFLHVIADTLSSVGVIVAAIVVALFHWLWADGAISLFVAGLITISALPLVVQSVTSLVRLDQAQQQSLDR
jgi:cobalt-zinc-cadmium efflux system protein